MSGRVRAITPHIERLLEKHPCSKCGQPCFRIAYAGHRLICIDCLTRIVEQADAEAAR